MSKFIINGQKRISGAYQPVGNKNAALPMLAASLLTDEPVVLHNVPDILDVQVTLDILSFLGVSIEKNKATVTLCAKGLRRNKLPPDLCFRVRSSILFAGPS